MSNLVGATSLQGTVSIQGTATDNVGVTRVEFYVDGTMANTSVSSPFSFSWNTTSATNGTHGLTVKAYDTAGNVPFLRSANSGLVNDGKFDDR